MPPAVGSVFLPTTSPAFNPIDQAFAKLKQLLRTAEARTVEAYMSAAQQHYGQITLADVRGFLRDAGNTVWMLR